MSSDLLSAIELFQTYGCAPVIIITVVGYDYILTFSREIDAVWRRPWTLISTFFLIIRYMGLCWAITMGFIGSIFVPGPLDTCVAIFTLGNWTYAVFLAAADFVMIMRVAALWNQSKIILSILFLIYVPQMAATILWYSLYENPGTGLSVTILRISDYSVCSYKSHSPPPMTYRAIPRYALGAALLILAVIPTLKQSFDMYKVSKHWQINRTMQLLVREGVVYFVVNLLFNITNAIHLDNVDAELFLDTLVYTLSCAIVPRFVINIRELYDRDVRERWQGIDTGFGRCLGQSTQGSSTIAVRDIELQAGEAIEVENRAWRV